MFPNRNQLGNLAQKNRLPAMYTQLKYANSGGLMAYGVSAADGWRRADRVIQ